MFGYQIAILLAATVIIPCVIGCFNYRHLPIHYKVILILLVIGLLNEILMFILPYFGINNLLSLHIFALVEIILLSLFFIYQLRSNREKRIVKVTMIGTAIFAMIYSLIGNNIAEFNSLPRAIESIYFSGLSCYIFYQISTGSEPVDDSIYFINGAILFYFTSCFLIFAFSKYISANNEDLLTMYNVHSIANAMCNIAYATGLWIASRSSYSPA